MSNNITPTTIKKYQDEHNDDPVEAVWALFKFFMYTMLLWFLIAFVLSVWKFRQDLRRYRDNNLQAIYRELNQLDRPWDWTPEQDSDDSD